MAPQVAGFEFVWSAVRRKEVQKSLIYSDGFVYLEGDPRSWIQRNLPLRLSIRSLELCDYDGEKIGDSITELAGLTHLSIRDSASLKCVANVLRLHNLQLLRIIHCENLEELPPNLGELRNLTHLELSRCKAIKSLPSFASLRNLQRLYLGLSVKELPINLDELTQLLLLDIKWCGNIKYLPCNIKNLINLQFLLLPWNFRLETLPFDLNDSVIISVESRHIRKTWEELKLEMGPLFVGASPSMVEMVMEAAQNLLPISGYLSLKEDPSTWIQIHYNLRFLLRILDLELPDTVGEIGDFIGMLPNLIHLYISATHYFQCLGNLSNLKSLDLCLSKTKLAAALDFPFCLEHLTLRYCDYYSLPDSVAKLSNLNTLELYRCNQVSMPDNLNLTKLKLVCCSVEPLPPCICFLEIVHDIDYCFHECGDYFKMSLKQLISLETLSLTCYSIKLLPFIAGQQLQTLLFKDCFNLRELMPNMDELIELCTLNISGTRIKYLPECITKLPKLQYLVLPKCFKQKNLPHQFLTNEPVVKIDFDRMDAIYYKDNGYCRSFYESSSETSDEEIEITPGSVAGEVDIIAVQASSCQMPNPHEATQDLGGENNHHASWCLQNQEMEGGDLSLQRGLSTNFGEGREIGTMNLGNQELAITSSNQLISSSGKKGRGQEKEITCEQIQRLRNEHITLIEAARKLAVSRSTMKRRCKELGLGKWPSSRKKSSCFKNVCLDVIQHNMSDLTHEGDSIDHSTPNATERVGALDVATHHRHMDVHESVHECMVGRDVNTVLGNVKDSSSSRSFDIKATYKDDIVRFKWYSTACLKELKEAMVENLKIEFGSFKLKYQDEEEDWVLINTDEHLKRARSLIKNNILRLKVTDL